MRRVLGALAAVVLVSATGGCGSDQDSYCDAVSDHQKRLSEVVGEGGPDALLKALPTFRDLQGQAPSDVRDEWQQVVSSIEALRKALDESGVDAAAYDPDKPPAGLSPAARKRIADAATEVGSAETLQALQDLDQEARDVCHTPLSL